MRVGAVFEWNNNIRYRVLNPFDALDRKGHDVVFGRKEQGARLDLSGLSSCEVIQVYRLVEPEDWRAVQRLAVAGAAIVWDTDDDLASTPRELPGYRRQGGLAARRDTARTTLAMARAAHGVTTSTDALAERYRAQGIERVDVLPNYLAPGEARIRPRKHGGVVIGWIAAAEHAADVQRLAIVDALEQLLATEPDVRLESIGTDLGLRHDRYRHIPTVPMNEFLEIARGWDIGIAPLADIPFNRARSDVKLKEYASLGIPWLASPVGPYVGLGEREGGRLVADDEWFEALRRLATSRFDRMRLGRRSRSWAKSQVADRHVDGWTRAFAAAVVQRSAAS